MKILVIGESTIAGVGLETQDEGFTATLATSLSQAWKQNVAWKIYAKSGYTVQEINEHIIPTISEENVDLIVIGVGGNDAFTLNFPFRWRREIQKLIESLQVTYREVPIVFANMPPIKEFPAFTPLIKWVIGNLGEILGEDLAKLIPAYQHVYYYADKVIMEDWQTRLNITADPSDFFSDGVHPSKLAYQLWARDLCRYMMAEIPAIAALSTE